MSTQSSTISARRVRFSLLELVLAVRVDLARRRVQADRDLLARLVAALLDRFEDQFDRLLVGFQFGAKPPSSPTPSTARAAHFLSAPGRSPPHPQGFRERPAPCGAIMNSWKSTGLSACSPPLRRSSAFRAAGGPARRRGGARGAGRPRPRLRARPYAREAPRIAFAPRRDLPVGVPSSSIRAWSRAALVRRRRGRGPPRQSRR